MHGEKLRQDKILKKIRCILFYFSILSENQPRSPRALRSARHRLTNWYHRLPVGNRWCKTCGRALQLSWIVTVHQKGCDVNYRVLIKR